MKNQIYCFLLEAFCILCFSSLLYLIYITIYYVSEKLTKIGFPQDFAIFVVGFFIVGILNILICINQNRSNKNGGKIRETR